MNDYKYIWLWRLRLGLVRGKLRRSVEVVWFASHHHAQLDKRIHRSTTHA